MGQRVVPVVSFDTEERLTEFPQSESLSFQHSQFTMRFSLRVQAVYPEFLRCLVGSAARPVAATFHSAEEYPRIGFSRHAHIGVIKRKIRYAGQGGLDRLAGPRMVTTGYSDAD